MPSSAVTLAVAWIAFAFRYSAPYFHNDHFEHLSMARQMLFGELPGRDFIDPGRPLTVGLSALGQWLSPTLFSEALLTIGLLAIGTAITFVLAARAARSVVLGLAGAVMITAIAPRLYSYPKILVFAVALLALWRWIEAPSYRRLALVALAEVFAFLMRSDFGVYFGVVAGATVLTTPRIVNWRGAAALLGMGLMLIAPYGVWLGVTGQLGRTSGEGAGKVLEMVVGGDAPRPALHFTAANGLVHLDPVVAQVTIRWTPAVDADTRTQLERHYGLIDPQPNGPRTFKYGLTDDSHANLRALVADPHVDDTGGFNRAAAMVERSLPERWARALSLNRITWGPFFTADEAGVWLYYSLWAIPLTALAWLAVTRRWRAQPVETRQLAAAAGLGVLVNLYLIRGSFDSRLADVIQPAAVVGPWLLRQVIDLTALVRPRVLRLAALVVPAAVVLLFWVALTTYDPSLTMGRLVSSPVRLPAIAKATTELRKRPIDFYAPPGDNGVKRLTRYVFDCLGPTDRLLLVAYEPQVFYYSERLFAGGMEYFHQGRFNSDAEQILTVRRLSAQPVPLVLVDEGRSASFEEGYPLVAAFVHRRFREVGHATFTDNRSWAVYADPTRTPVTTREGLPCYQDPSVTMARSSP